MKFSKVPIDSFLGKVLRLPLRMIPENWALPILQSEMSGMRWIVGSSNHGCWLGSFEYEKRVLFEEHVTKGDVIWDIGANVGFYTLLSSQLTGSTGKVFAFEPLPRNLGYLRKHIKLNNRSNIEVKPYAIADKEGEIGFTGERSTAHISDQGDKKVEVLTLDGLINSEELPLADVVKIDIEGAEAKALKGGERFFRTHSPKVFLATHGPSIHKECIKLLRNWDYKLEPIGKSEIQDTSELVAYK